jgi:hypothetical protein
LQQLVEVARAGDGEGIGAWCAQPQDVLEQEVRPELREAASARSCVAAARSAAIISAEAMALVWSITRLSARAA